MKHLVGSFHAAPLDRAPFLFRHRFAEHPALSLENLVKVIPSLPERCINYSKGLDSVALNFDSSFDEFGNGLNLRQTVERLKEVSSYITVMDPQDHAPFKDLYRELRNDVEELQREAGRKPRISEPRLWLFIASPGAVTPFHFDRYSNFLMQIQGSKQMAIFPNFREEIVPARECEAYMDREPAKALWRDELDQFAVKYDFRPGDALHIPFAGGHYVKNGTEDVSVSLSYFFQTQETQRWVRAMQFNNRVYRRLGIQLGPVGRTTLNDSWKASALDGLHATAKIRRRVRSLRERFLSAERRR